jgi:hypothetical protein
VSDRILAESRGALLMQAENGAVYCGRCPFACLAASEPCEFAWGQS